jgi:hypothetical protein
VFVVFLRKCAPDVVFRIAPGLLSARIFYAREINGREE